jgi:hypothetical protein
MRLELGSEIDYSEIFRGLPQSLHEIPVRPRPLPCKTFLDRRNTFYQLTTLFNSPHIVNIRTWSWRNIHKEHFEISVDPFSHIAKRLKVASAYFFLFFLQFLNISNIGTPYFLSAALKIQLVTCSLLLNAGKIEHIFRSCENVGFWNII